MKCKHCGSEFEGKFCPECGTRAELETTVVSQNAQEQKDAAQQNFPVFKAKTWFDSIGYPIFRN